MEDKHFHIEPCRINEALRISSRIHEDSCKDTSSLYGTPDLVSLVERSILAVRLTPYINPEDHNARAVFVFDYAVPSWYDFKVDMWTKVNNMTKLSLNSFNSIFLVYAWVDASEDYLTAYREVARYVFFNNPDLEYVILLNENIKLLSESESKTIQVLQNPVLFVQKSDDLYLMPKTKVIEPITIRRAREEDQDDLSSICETQSELQRSLFGEFFLAELISSVSRDKICLVAENPKKQVVGLLVASDNVNYTTLIENYQLKNYKYLTKSDFYEEYVERMELKHKLKDIWQALEEQKEQVKFETMKKRYSRDILLRELQEFCLINKDGMIQEFEIYLTDTSRQKVLNKNLVRRKLEKLLKNHKIVVPNDCFEKIIDLDVECCIQTPVDMALELFQYFGLNKNYMEGEDHWNEWIQRKVEEYLDDNKQKGLLGKKKRQTSKKQKDSSKDNKLQKPDSFDIFPLYKSLERVLLASPKVREHIHSLFTEHKNDILELFCDENGEILNYRSTTFDEIIKHLKEKLKVEIDDEVATVIPFVFFAFGKLPYVEEIVTIKDKTKFKQFEAYIDVLTKKTIRKVNYNEMIKSLDHLKEYDKLFNHKSSYIIKLNQQYETMFNDMKAEILKNKNLNREFYSHFEADSEDIEGRFKDVPEQIKDAVAVNIFIMAEDFHDQAFKFLPHVFDYFPEKSYVVINMPYKAVEMPLLQEFIYVKHKETSNFSQSLHLIHKYNLLKEHIQVQKEGSRTANSNFFIFDILLQLGPEDHFKIGQAVAEKNLAIKSLKNDYDVADRIYTKAFVDNELIEIKEITLSPLFFNLHSFVLREILYNTSSRIAYKKHGKTSLGVSDILFDPLHRIQVQGLIADKKPETIDDIGVLKLSNLWKPKVNINARILVVGFTASAIGTINSLLSNPQFNLRNIIILSQNFSWIDAPLKDQPDNIDYDINYIENFLIKRTRMVRGQLLSINRKLKEAYVKNINDEQFTIEYDYLILCNGLEEKTIDKLKQENKAIENVPIPEFIVSVKDFNERFVKTIKDIQKELKLKNTPYDCQSVKKMMVNRKNWVSQLMHDVLPSKIVLYGLSLELFVLANDLIENWQVQPANILVIIPDDTVKDYKINDNNQMRLDLEEELVECPRVIINEDLWEFYQNELEKLGIVIIKNYQFYEFNEAERSITLVNNTLDMMKKPNVNQNKSSRFSVSMTRNESLDNNNMYIDDALLILGNNYDIANNVFHTIQENGLVYNGRLIVQANFRTVDENIYAAGLICEFSQRYKNYTMGRSMRMDRYNQFEVGKYFSQVFIEELQYNEEKDNLPFFNGLLGYRAKIIGGFTYIYISYPYLGMFDTNQTYDIITDDQLNKKTEYFSMAFDSNDLLKEIIYFGKQEVNHLALKNIMNLHRSYFNEMFSRYENGLIESFIEYLNQAWANMLFHPLFNRFNTTIQKLLGGQVGVIDENNLPEEIQHLITYGVYDFIKEHKKHFPNYYVQDINYKL